MEKMLKTALKIATALLLVFCVCATSGAQTVKAALESIVPFDRTQYNSTGTYTYTLRVGNKYSRYDVNGNFIETLDIEIAWEVGKENPYEIDTLKYMVMFSSYEAVRPDTMAYVYFTGNQSTDELNSQVKPPRITVKRLVAGNTEYTYETTYGGEIFGDNKISHSNRVEGHFLAAVDDKNGRPSFIFQFKDSADGTIKVDYFYTNALIFKSDSYARAYVGAQGTVSNMMDISSKYPSGYVMDEYGDWSFHGGEGSGNATLADYQSATDWLASVDVAGTIKTASGTKDVALARKYFGTKKIAFYWHTYEDGEKELRVYAPNGGYYIDCRVDEYGKLYYWRESILGVTTVVKGIAQESYSTPSAVYTTQRFSMLSPLVQADGTLTTTTPTIYGEWALMLAASGIYTGMETAVEPKPTGFVPTTIPTPIPTVTPSVCPKPDELLIYAPEDTPPRWEITWKPNATKNLYVCIDVKYRYVSDGADGQIQKYKYMTVDDKYSASNGDTITITYADIMRATGAMTGTISVIGFDVYFAHVLDDGRVVYSDQVYTASGDVEGGFDPGNFTPGQIINDPSIWDAISDIGSIFTTLLNAISSLIGMVGQLPVLMGSMFFFVPPEIQSIMGVGIIVCVILGVVRWIRG